MLDEAAVAWFKTRGISRTTLERMKVASGTTDFPGAGRLPCVVFPYYKNGKIINVKYRSYPEKNFKQLYGGEQRLYNLDAALGAERVYIVEGEIDCLSLMESGLSAPVSIPAGANGQPDYLNAAWAEGLSKSKVFVLSGDTDPPGLQCRKILAEKIGPARCSYIDWPDKDANDFLVKYGPDALKDYVSRPKPWPVPGLLTMGEIDEPPPIDTWEPGFHEWGGRIRFARGMVSIVTGQPGHGKTSLFAQIWHDILRRYDLVGCFGSFETRPKPHYRRILRQCRYRANELHLTDQQRTEADEWISDHTRWLVHPNQQPTLGWVLDAAETAVIRNNAALLQIDPWNRLVPDRGQFERETDWVSRSLDRCLDFAKGMNCHVQIIAHPAKGDFQSRKHHPCLEDISGSKHWDNKADQGIVVWRPKVYDGKERQTGAEVIQLKARYQELGYPCKLPVRLNLLTGCFEPVSQEPIDDPVNEE